MKKWWIAVLVSSSLQVTQAQTPAQNTEQVRAIEFMQSIAGYFKGDTCELSISIDTELQVAEVLLRNRKTGEEFYLPVDFKSRDTQRTRFALQNGRRMFHYEFYDYNPDPGHGSIAVFLFEAVKTEDLSKLEYVEFGLRRPTDSRIQWAVCRMENKK
jgi:hypothetical protein